MRLFITIILHAQALGCMLMGILMISMSVRAERVVGANLPLEVCNDPTLNNQLSYYGAICLGYGPLIYLCIYDMRKYSSVLRIVLGVIFLGGLGRIIPLIRFGLPSPEVTTLMVLEIGLVPVALWWHSRFIRDVAKSRRYDSGQMSQC